MSLPHIDAFALSLNKEYLGYEQIFVLFRGWLRGTYLCFKA